MDPVAFPTATTLREQRRTDSIADTWTRLVDVTRIAMVTNIFSTIRAAPSQTYVVQMGSALADVDPDDAAVSLDRETRQLLLDDALAAATAWFVTNGYSAECALDQTTSPPEYTLTVGWAADPAAPECTQ